MPQGADLIALGQQEEALLQVLGDPFRGLVRQQGGRQFDGKRQAVQAAADLEHGGTVFSGHRKIGLDRLRPRGEQPGCVIVQQRFRREGGVFSGQRQSRNLVDCL